MKNSVSKTTQTSGEGKPRGLLRQYQPAWVTFLLLVFSLYLTTRYYKGIESSELFPSNILVVTLVNVNIILVILLILLLSRNLIKAYFERRLRVLGSGFRTKLIVAFVGLSLIPSVLLFAVATGLLTSSIENWFSIQVDRSLESSLKIAQDVHQGAKDRSMHSAGELANGIWERRLLDGTDPGTVSRYLEGKLRELRLTGIEVYRNPRQPFVRVTAPDFESDHFISPSAELLKTAFTGTMGFEEIPFNHGADTGKIMRSVAPVPGSAQTGGLVVVDLYLPGALLGQMDQITRSFEDFKQLKAFKNPIKGSYILSFLIITLLIIFSATWFGFYIAKGITIPIQKLAEGTHAVAQGNLDFRIDVKARDEIGILVKSFNKMTEDLKSSKTNLETANLSLQLSNTELDRRRAYIETILDNITTGVLSIDSQGFMTTFNRAAERILSIKPEEFKERPYAEPFKQYGLDALVEAVDELRAGPKSTLEKEVAVNLKGKAITLHLTLSKLQEEDGRPIGSVMVFDDLSELIKVQKVAAWQEVAKRIAHEIKNPLTPIQLSAQRLRKKYFEEAGDFNDIFDEATKIIIGEVNSLKSLVDEFSQFARMPSPQPEPTSLEAILQEVIPLYQGAHKDVRILCELDPRIPTLRLDRDHIKRVFVNLFENAIEALNKKGRIWVRGVYEPTEQKVRIEVSDEGGGIQPEDLEKLFMPYFSKKKSGTGLGLAIVNRIISDHNGLIRVVQNEPRGTKFIIDLPVDTAIGK